MTDVNPAPPGSASDDEEPDGTQARKEAESTLPPREPDLQSRFYQSAWAPGWHSMCVGGGSARSDFETHSLIKDWRDVVENALPLRDMNVWFSRNGMNARPMRGRGGEKDIGTAKCIAVDLDWIAPGAHSDNEKLLTEDQTWTIVEQLDIMPSWVVATGHGVQVYWCFGDVVEAKVADRMQRKLGVWLRGHGLHPERLDLSGVMRVPGTMNVKIADEPKPVTIEFEGPIYESSQLEALLPSLPEPAETPKPSAAAKMLGMATTGQTPAEWFVENCDYLSMLIADGWQEHSRRGDEVMLTRPGKEVADGKSAVLHLDGHQTLVIFSSAIANELRVADRMTTAGTVSLDAFEYLAAVKFRGAKTEAARHVRNLMPKRETKISTDLKPSDLVLEDEFWDTEQLRHIRTAAESRLVSPRALLAAVLVRRVTMVPPNVALPPIVGSRASLNLYLMLVAPPGVGKTTVIQASADLVERDESAMSTMATNIMWDRSISTYAGICATFWGDVETENGKEKQFLPGRSLLGIIDEARQLVPKNSQDMKTVELLTGLRAMWSGAEAGQLNADETRRRPIPAHGYRFNVVAGAQPSVAEDILADVGHGTPQRFLFVDARPEYLVDEDEEPMWPGPLDLPRGPFYNGQQYVMEFPAEIVKKIRRHRRSTAIEGTEELETHDMQQTMKWAAAFSLLEGNDLVVTERHWQKAVEFTGMAFLTRRVELERARQRKKTAKLEAKRAERQIDAILEHEEDDSWIETDAEKMARAVWRKGPKTAGELRLVIQAKHRAVRWPSSDAPSPSAILAVERGWLAVEQTVKSARWIPGAVTPPDYEAE
jgi:hypothetical protein